MAKNTRSIKSLSEITESPVKPAESTEYTESAIDQAFATVVNAESVVDLDSLVSADYIPVDPSRQVILWVDPALAIQPAVNPIVTESHPAESNENESDESADKPKSKPADPRLVDRILAQINYNMGQLRIATGFGGKKDGKKADPKIPFPGLTLLEDYGMLTPAGLPIESNLRSYILFNTKEESLTQAKLDKVSHLSKVLISDVKFILGQFQHGRIGSGIYGHFIGLLPVLRVYECFTDKYDMDRLYELKLESEKRQKESQANQVSYLDRKADQDRKYAGSQAKYGVARMKVRDSRQYVRDQKTIAESEYLTSEERQETAESRSIALGKSLAIALKGQFCHCGFHEKGVAAIAIASCRSWYDRDTNIQHEKQTAYLCSAGLLYAIKKDSLTWLNPEFNRKAQIDVLDSDESGRTVKLGVTK